MSASGSPAPKPAASCACPTPLNCAAFGCLKALRAEQARHWTGTLPPLPDVPTLSDEELEGLVRAAAWFPATMELCDRAFAEDPDLDWEIYNSLHKDNRSVGATLSLRLHPASEIARRLAEERGVLRPWGPGDALPGDFGPFSDPGLRSSYGGLVLQIATSLRRLLDFLGTRRGVGAGVVSRLLREAMLQSGVPAHLVPAVDQTPGRPAGEFLAIAHMHRSGLLRPSPEVALAAGTKPGSMLDPRFDQYGSDGNPGLTRRHPIPTP